MRFMQIESVLQTKNRSEPAKNRFSVAMIMTISETRVVFLKPLYRSCCYKCFMRKAENNSIVLH